MEQMKEFDQKYYDLANQTVKSCVDMLVPRIQAKAINMAYLGIYAETEQEMPVVEMRHSESDAGDVYTIISPLFIYTIKLGIDGSLVVETKAGHDHVKSGEKVLHTVLAREGHAFNIEEINQMTETPITSDLDYANHVKKWFKFIDENIDNDFEDANIKTIINTDIDDARVASGKLGDRAFRAQNQVLEDLLEVTNHFFQK